jgi:RimJ/RimL family protein N-acetyltransferase
MSVMSISSAAVPPILRDVPDVIRTARLIIRPPRPGDGAAVFEAVRESIPDLRRFPASMGWALAEPSVAESERFCRQAYSDFVARRDLPLIALLGESSTIVVSSGLHRIDWTVPKFEVGYWGRTSFQGNGYATEAVRAIVEMAFDRLGARRVEALPDEENGPSRRVCERVGLILEGVLHHERIAPDGTLRNTCVYAKAR